MRAPMTRYTPELPCTRLNLKSEGTFPVMKETKRARALVTRYTPEWPCTRLNESVTITSDERDKEGEGARAAVHARVALHAAESE